MSSVSTLQRDWTQLARTDPLWAVLMDPAKRGGRWDEGEFFATGEREIESVLDYVGGLGISVDLSGSALDFGCGVGRLTQALAGRFSSVVGVDISEVMIELAKSRNRFGERCHYVVNESDDLSCFDDGDFSVVYSSIVLQHMPASLAAGYVQEFVRVAAPGGVVVFQVADGIQAGLVARVLGQVRAAVPRQRLASLRARILEGDAEGQRRCKMHAFKEPRVREAVDATAASIVDVRYTNSTELSFCGGIEYFNEAPANQRWASKQYCLRKDV